MNWPYVHLLINHVPIILVVLGAAAAVLGFIKPRRVIWLYAVATLTLAGLSAYPVFFSGDEAHHVMEDKPGVDRDNIEEHEEAGEFLLWVLLIDGALGAYMWWMLAVRDKAGIGPTWLRALVLIGALVGVAAAYRTSLLGGYIIHGKDSQGSPGGSATAPPSSE
jgi:uncharacterized membrane protein